MPVQKVSEDNHRRLTGLAEKTEPKIASSFLSSVNSAKNELNLNELSELLENGRVNTAIELTQNIPLSIASGVGLAYTTSGDDSSNEIAAILGAAVFFDQTTSRAVDFQITNRFRITVEFNSEQALTNQESIINSIRSGATPRQTAINFRDSIGLTRDQLRSVNKFRTLLENRSREALRRTLRDKSFDNDIRLAIEQNRPLPQRQINTMVDRYRNNFINYRADTIARTETLRSVQTANNEAYEQIIESGRARARQLIRSWWVRLDGRERDSHHTMYGQQRAMREFFVSGAGNLLMYPGDSSAPASEVISCRCSLTTSFRR